MSFALREGRPFPLGATWDGSGTNFAIFSAHARKVELCLFDARGRREIARVALPEYTHEVWHGYLPEVRPGQLYGYRVHGPYEPQAGLRFNPNKLLIDPYALMLQGEVVWHDAVFGYRMGNARADLSFDRRDSAFVMPKCVVVDPAVTWGPDYPPNIPWAETIIYEAHVKGMTALNPAIPDRVRGSFAALADPRAIEHLVTLGVTAIELMPTQAFFDDRYLIEKGLTNYWGYNTIGFFAPATRYISPGGGVHEFKLMVRRLHEAGIEVILDVVYNHTAEGNHLGPTLSFKGIDNASYYMLGDDPRYYYDTTGCGNTVNLGHQRVLQMVMDSLRYWVEACHVDGFRFDLATSLGRDRQGFNANAVFLDAVRQDPVLSRVKLIAEPWDTGHEGYQLGNFPPGWAEWNDQYRDTVRSYWKGDEGELPGLASQLLGSAGHFDRRGRRPWASVNFITAHDGFTLADTVSYNDKHNAANEEENRDGHSDNRSWNCGAEGPTEDAEVLDLRDRMRRAMMGTLLISQGTPMLLMGDEVGRSQAGNNNAYCQDNAMNWLKLDGLEPRDAAFLDFTRRLIALRKSRPLLRHPSFLHKAAVGEEPVEVRWLRPDGEEMEPDDWHNPAARTLGLLIRNKPALLTLLNSHFEEVPFSLPDVGRGWGLLLDTAAGRVPERPEPQRAAGFAVPPRTLLVLEETE
ncbi:glycogen debranching protein GlgX [Cereibacter johrii]|uniref:Glycogen operon protein n=1 Tax=Cereibacter johrii TaxID=445629 RepID=A0ABX5JFF3_9RHOB|nr:glycogen debranching protein GlgX [Cereibacter johrii]ODM41551.1 glycogen debranching enzyme GlgX [Cereibacter johrii]PTM81818.1 glycogen operon protein [Cereibacter johrii]RDS96331.1 glycogen debranching enzyme GlgX [Cereibacter sphaeroides f. sp. denitrificans]